MSAENHKHSHLCAFLLLTSVHTREMLIRPTTMLSTDTADITQTISGSCRVSTDCDFHRWIQLAISVSLPINTSTHKSRTLLFKALQQGVD